MSFVTREDSLKMGKKKKGVIFSIPFSTQKKKNLVKNISWVKNSVNFGDSCRTGQIEIKINVG